LEIAADQAEQRCLAAAVAADQAHPMAGRKVQRGAIQQQPAADPQGDIVQVQHGAELLARAAGTPKPRPACPTVEPWNRAAANSHCTYRCDV
jgi:hypothetical protein